MDKFKYFRNGKDEDKHRKQQHFSLKNPEEKGKGEFIKI